MGFMRFTRRSAGYLLRTTRCFIRRPASRYRGCLQLLWAAVSLRCRSSRLSSVGDVTQAILSPVAPVGRLQTRPRHGYVAASSARVSWWVVLVQAP